MIVPQVILDQAMSNLIIWNKKHNKIEKALFFKKNEGDFPPLWTPSSSTVKLESTKSWEKMDSTKLQIKGSNKNTLENDVS